MINIRNKKKTGFYDEKANLNNTRFIDDSAILNNVKKSSKKIELDDKFVMPERTDIDKNVFTNKTTTKDYDKYIKSEDTNIDIINDYVKVTTAEKEFKKDYYFLAHENFKYEKRLNDEILKHNPIKILANHFKEALNAFGITSNVLNQLNLAQSIAKIIAPAPTPQEVDDIKRKLLSLDVSLLTNYYIISQIIQSPELLNVIKTMFEQFEKVQNSPESKYVISLVKHVMDYIVLNQNNFGMPQFLQTIYNKYFGSNANINTNVPTVEPTNQPITFGHDQTLTPSERITEPPTPAPIPPTPTPTQITAGMILPSEPQPQYDPEQQRINTASIVPTTQPPQPPQPSTSDSSNVPNYYGSQYQSNPDLDYLMNKFNNAFSTNIQTMKMLYFQIIDKIDPILNKYPELFKTLFLYDNMYDLPEEAAPGKLFIINLFNAFNNISIPTLNDFKQILRAKSDQIMNSPEYTVPGALDITPLEGFVPINYIRPPPPQPTTITKPYDVKPTQQITSSMTPSYVSQPTTGPQIRPTPEPIRGGSMGSSRLASKVQPSKIKVKISRSEASKIIAIMLHNSTNSTDLKNNLNIIPDYIDKISKGHDIIKEGAEMAEKYSKPAIAAGILSIAGSALLIAAKFYFGARRRPRFNHLTTREYEEATMTREMTNLLITNTDLPIPNRSLMSDIVRLASNMRISTVQLAQAVLECIRSMANAGSAQDVTDAVRDLELQAVREQGVQEGVQSARDIELQASKERFIRIMQSMITNGDRYIKELDQDIEKINFQDLNASFERYQNFYEIIQKITDTLNVRLESMGIKPDVVIKRLARIGEVNFPLTKLKENYDKKNFKTLVSKLIEIWNLQTEIELSAETPEGVDLLELQTVQDNYIRTLKDFIKSSILVFKPRFFG